MNNQIPKTKLFYFFLALLFVAFLASGGIFVKLSSIGPINTGFYRILFSIPILYPFMKIENNKYSISSKDKLVMMIAGIFLGVDLTLWNISLHYTTVANANLFSTLVQFTIIPVSYFLYKEKISKNFLISLFITLFGVFLLIKGKPNPTSGNFYGDTLAFLTSIFYAGFLLIVYKIRSKASFIQIMYYSAFGSLIVLFFTSVIIEGITIPTTIKELYPIIFLTIFSQIIGQGGLSFVLGKISANLASLLVLTQPVISGLYSLIVFNEVLSTLEIIGLFILTIGIFIVKKN